MLSKAQINTLVRRWQKKLGLADWKITVVLASTADEIDGCAGTILWETEYHSATMTLAAELSRADLEETVIHELLHLLFEGHKSATSRYDAMYERGLNTLSAILAKK